MNVRPYTPESAIAAVVATTITSSKHTGQLLYKAIADTVETEVADKDVLIAEVVFNVGTQIKFEHTTSKAGSDADTKELANRVAEQTLHIYNSDPRRLYANDDDFIEASSNGFEDMIFNENYDTDTSIGHHALALATLLKLPHPHVISLV